METLFQKPLFELETCSQLRLRRINGNIFGKRFVSFIIFCSQLRLRRINGNVLLKPEGLQRSKVLSFG